MAYRRNSHLRKKYGISLEDYDAMHDEQRGVCAICGNEESQNRHLSVDHDHETGRVRGLLCGSCNTKLGWFERNRQTIDAHLKEA